MQTTDLRILLQVAAFASGVSVGLLVLWFIRKSLHL